MFKELFKHWTYQVFAPGTLLRKKYESFKSLLEIDRACLERIAELEELYYSNAPTDWTRVQSLVRELMVQTDFLVRELMAMSPGRYLDLPDYRNKISFYLTMAAELPDFDFSPPYAITLNEAISEPGQAGGKAHNLALLADRGDLPVPQGFVITTRAFHYFIEYNELRPRIDTLLGKVNLDAPGFVSDVCTEIQRLILSGDIPPSIEEEYRKHAIDLAASRGGDVRLAVRSSAVGEDSAASFAGQYESELNVALSDLGPAYKRVLASKYSAKAVTYRIRYGLPDQLTPMAVLVTEMITPSVSGVVYTRDPGHTSREQLAIYAVQGMGRNLVDGSASPEILTLTRDKVPTIIERRAGGGAPQVVCGDTPDAGPCLPEEHALTLARVGMRLEKMMGAPQDIEWCMDPGGSLFVVQSRPLSEVEPLSCDRQSSLSPDDIDNELLVSGNPASMGIGIGHVYKPMRLTDLDDVADGCVLVADTLSPAFASVLERLAAVVTDTGSKASHFASVAREFGLPVVVDAKFATRILTDGMQITVYADTGHIYAGEVRELKALAGRPPAPRDTPFHRRMAEVMNLVAPLHLTNPDASEFAPQGCRSIHDIVRFCHETGVSEMFSLVGKGGRGLAKARRFEGGLPMTMYMLDLGGGLTPQAATTDTLDPCHFASDAISAFWEGLNHPDIQWDGSLLAFDWEEFDKVSGGIISLESKTLASYAILGKDYMHLLMRFGYHFAVIDTICGPVPESNYINFRFKGGGAEIGKRMLRLELVRKVLTSAGFTVTSKGDMLDARFMAAPAPKVELNLTLIGMLLGKTRLLDMALTGDTQVQHLVDEFLDSL
ncbi:PEP/pyruvate-binding domain-containing protein [Desulfovibrio ferrophilus]|uniref:Phosphoenolpyruvate synthase n=1 Tax=Desulfovibrio ferrophilus TaxID=241368 RepID=A0A2Z6B2T7_9BACT|nr:PEP/pyruvate-binding domain-containing protein [Desulfovibrio ferrophilus]BBD09829.1 pyruvate, water dikinase [Desulfovibrio ferrophilus]